MSEYQISMIKQTRPRELLWIWNWMVMNMLRDAHEKEVRHYSVWLFRSIQYKKADSWLGLHRKPDCKAFNRGGEAAITMMEREKTVALVLDRSGCSRRVHDSIGNALEVTGKSSVIKDARFQVNHAYGDHLCWLIFHADRDAFLSERENSILRYQEETGTCLSCVEPLRARHVAAHKWIQNLKINIQN